MHFLAWLAVVDVAPPRLPKQTPQQAAIVQRAVVQADAAAAEGSARLLRLLSAPATRSFLQSLDDGSMLYKLPASELRNRLVAELDAAELVHSFGDVSDGNCGQDITLADGVGAPYFYNQWLLQALRIRPIDPAQNVFSEAAETAYFGFEPFRNISAPDLPTATDRPVYAALNMYRNAAGNPQCGPVSAVFSRRYVGTQAIAAPVDTGLFYGSCGKGESGGRITPASEVCLDCSAWPSASGRPLGVPGKLTHLIEPYARFYNATAEIAGAAYPQYNLARLVIRLLSRETYREPVMAAVRVPSVAGLGHVAAASTAPLRLNFMEDTWGYLELNPAVTIAEPHGVLIMIGTFDLWFGNANGTRLRKWCVERGWPLAWAHDPLSSLWRCGVNTSAGGDCTPPQRTFAHGVAPANARLLDPYVMRRVPAGHNVTSTGAFGAAEVAFESRWASIEKDVPTSLSPAQRRAVLDPQWSALLPATRSLALEPKWAGACADDDCAGVRVLDGSCVCAPRGPG